MAEKNYRIIITRFEHPIADEIETSQSKHRRMMNMGMDDNYPRPTMIEPGVLSTELTEDQFKTVQREILKVFE